jgi:hypothetical protein
MNAALLMVLCFLVLSLTVSGFGGGSGMPGGWSYVDPNDLNVQRAAHFAIATKYIDKKPQFIVVLAKQQVNAPRQCLA